MFYNFYVPYSLAKVCICHVASERRCFFAGCAGMAVLRQAAFRKRVGMNLVDPIKSILKRGAESAKYKFSMIISMIAMVHLCDLSLGDPPRQGSAGSVLRHLSGDHRTVFCRHTLYRLAFRFPAICDRAGSLWILYVSCPDGQQAQICDCYGAGSGRAGFFYQL